MTYRAGVVVVAASLLLLLAAPSFFDDNDDVDLTGVRIGVLGVLLLLHHPEAVPQLLFWFLVHNQLANPEKSTISHELH